MAEPARKLATVDDLMAFEGERDRRYQLIDGEIVMMAPALRPHGIIAINLGAALRNRLRSPCRAQGEAGIRLPWTSHDFYVADLAVSCAPIGRERWCPDPVLIAEVLSPTTEGEDRKTKLPDYRQLPSVQHILLASTEQPVLEHYARAGRFWHLQDLGPADVLALEAFGIEIPVQEIYDGILFEDEQAGEGG